MTSPESRASRFKKLAEGMITVREPGAPTAAAVGARCAVTESGHVVCTFMVQSASGINDFKPMLARSSDGGALFLYNQRKHPPIGVGPRSPSCRVACPRGIPWRNSKQTSLTPSRAISK